MTHSPSQYDIIIIGGGHAGVEAAWAASQSGWYGSPSREQKKIALITMDPSKIGVMSCNPAIGGLAKGQIVREIDALGGLMGRAIDHAGILFKTLNASRGPAVRGPRAQADKYAYAAEVQRLIASSDSEQPGIEVIAGTVDDLIRNEQTGNIHGIILAPGSGMVNANPRIIEMNLQGDSRAEPIYPRQPSPENTHADSLTLSARSVVLTTGTFMRALMHTGNTKTPGGRIGEGSATGISATLHRLGFELGRLKTGTPPRLAQESLDWIGLDPQSGDDPPEAFSFLSPSILPSKTFPTQPAAECRITHTTSQGHAIIRANLHRAPMFSGQIEAESGPRYCPSIEDKIVRFAERNSHHVFLEPESLFTNEIYANGISTSLPLEVQEQFVRLMPGCSNAIILRHGYAVEYDMVRPHQIDATCMTKSIPGLFLAGQINGTSGYEEAAGQGLLAGLNAARWSEDKEPVRLGRDEAYIGVMLDDLVTRIPTEPYRMFTSRAEHRLHLRADNADLRLTPLARNWGVINDYRWTIFKQRRQNIESLRKSFDTIRIEGKTLREIARRPDTPPQEIISHLNGQSEPIDHQALKLVITEARYDGYLNRQRAEIKRQKDNEHRRIPSWLNYPAVSGLRSEAIEVLQQFQPTTLGQATRLPGVNPADLTLLLVAIKRGPNVGQDLS